MVRTNTGYDFSRYKRSTIERRIQRRMALHQIQEMGDYRRYLRQNAAEIDNLFQDMTIKVTRFFRDPEAFEVLKKKALATPAAPKRSGQYGAHLGAGLRHRRRSLFPGHCGPGKHPKTLEKFFEFKIFATDINTDCHRRRPPRLFPAEHCRRRLQ